MSDSWKQENLNTLATLLAAGEKSFEFYKALYLVASTQGQENEAVWAYKRMKNYAYYNRPHSNALL